MQVDQRKVLVTGGTSGIGLALARALLQRGARVLVTGRRQSALQEALEDLRRTSDAVSGIAADVATAEGRAATLQAARTSLGGLDILVNNAGAVRAGRLETLSDDDVHAMLTTNLLAPILLTRDALPLLRESGDSLLVNVSSGIALVPVPFYSVYAAAKAGVVRFGDAMRRELHGEGVRVLNAYPTATDTPMMRTRTKDAPLDDADAVALAIAEAIEQDLREVIRGGDARRQQLALERDDPAALDARFAAMKPQLEAAVAHHKSL